MDDSSAFGEYIMQQVDQAFAEAGIQDIGCDFMTDPEYALIRNQMRSNIIRCLAHIGLREIIAKSTIFCLTGELRRLVQTPEGLRAAEQDSLEHQYTHVAEDVLKNLMNEGFVPYLRYEKAHGRYLSSDDTEDDLPLPDAAEDIARVESLARIAFDAHNSFYDRRYWTAIDEQEQDAFRAAVREVLRKNSEV